MAKVYINDPITLEVDLSKIDFSLTCLKEAENIYICGYRASDLVIIAERYKLAKIDNKLLADNNKAYIDGYNKAHEEIQKSIDNIVGSFGKEKEL